MFSRTSELAIRALIFLALQEDASPLSPRQIAAKLDCSPSYLAKTIQLLVKAGILRSVRGATGGVLLARRPADVTLLEIFEACQGLLIGNYCTGMGLPLGGDPCGYHVAMQELHEVTRRTLSKWTLGDLLASPAREPGPKDAPVCKMYFEGCPEKTPSKGERGTAES